MAIDKDFTVEVRNVTIQRAGKAVVENISFALHAGDHLAITGPSGSGKTTLASALAGNLFYTGAIEFAAALFPIVWVEQQHHFKNLFNTNDLYYQQRFNSCDAEATQTVQAVLQEIGNPVTDVLRIMKIGYLADKPLIQLSSGENKKLQLAKALALQPAVLIMDQPFTGLDKETRGYLHTLINDLATSGIIIILITAAEEIPACITKVLTLENGQLKAMQSRDEFKSGPVLHKLAPNQNSFNADKLKQLSSGLPGPAFDIAIGMRDVHVRYGDKQILQAINWEVKRGERWLLSGANGAGKSTLLSLVTADNPQAYANEIFLFDKRRGTGESIWDIKKKIGYLSPELHVFFDQGATCFEAVASGLFDTIGLFRQLSDQQVQLVQEWISVAGIMAIAQKRLLELSAGEQRLVLLVRALVKNPPLLILDEPCQGLDEEKQAELLSLIDEVCLYGNKTMVFVTHYAQARPACIDRFVQLEQGRLLPAV